MCDVVAAGGGALRRDLVADMCEAFAELIHDHPQAAEYTARKLSAVLRKDAQRADELQAAAEARAEERLRRFG